MQWVTKVGILQILEMWFGITMMAIPLGFLGIIGYSMAGWVGVGVGCGIYIVILLIVLAWELKLYDERS